MGWAATVLRVELGDTRDPSELVPGDPAAVTNTAHTLDRFGAALRCAGEGLQRIDTGGWTGTAADRFQQIFATEPDRWISSGRAFTTAAQALGDYADTLAWAQSQAAEAIALWDHGEAQTEHARAVHTAAVRQAHQHALAASLAGMFVPVPDLPFHDPGQATRDHARDLLDRARAQLADAGNHAERVIAEGRDQAPAGPRWWQTGWRLLREYQTGVYESVEELATLAWATSPPGIMMNPAGFVHTVTAMAHGAWYGVQHPVEFAKAVTDWETWQTNPARALGRLAPDLALTIATGGTATTTRAASKGTTAAHRLDNTPTPTPQHHPTAPHLLRGVQTGSVRVQPPTARPGPANHGTDLTPGPAPDFGPTGHHDPAPDVPDSPPPSGDQGPARPDWPDEPVVDHPWDSAPDDPAEPPPSDHQPAPSNEPAEHRPGQDYLDREFRADLNDHQAYQDESGPPSPEELRNMADWWKHYTPYAQLADQELLALLRYSSEYRDINHALRTGDPELLAAFDPHIREVASALHKLPDHQGPVFRGISIGPDQLADFLSRYQPGTHITEPGFTSTSTNAPYAGNVQFVIESRSGTYLPRPTDTYTGLNEVIFPPGHSFQVDGVHIDPHTDDVLIRLIDLG